MSRFFASQAYDEKWRRSKECLKSKHLLQEPVKEKEEAMPEVFDPENRQTRVKTDRDKKQAELDGS